MKNTLFAFLALAISVGAYAQKKVKLEDNSNASNFYFNNGMVGIGISTPKAKLDVKGYTKLVNPSGRSLIVEKDDDDSWLTFHDPGQYWYSEGIDRSNAGAFNINFGGTLNSSQFVMYQNGNVGIGTSNPGTWKLAVNGKVRAKEVQVETGWADFVFEADYVLPTLSEVENHIKEKGHLKDIPSAEEVEKNGISLGKINAKLLQKIEELTLYTIQQQKEIQNLKNKNEKLESLSKRLNDIEQLLKTNK
ncbi:hypothetical protein AWE51_18615 [Aquimarina aggregata]|uniref:Cell wall anchor protein n=1 Tax=Aquimarina aggregata TaxID=1642818 RepID=A0A162WFJ1_9FLAO|nr:hypothetical protein [Aquimarina aggregata]KZS38060.1 hypothetical protein AWE51_18615 [Aquimarina aggregata]